MRWVDRFQEEEEIKRHNRKPIAYKIQKDQVKFILTELKNNKTIKNEELINSSYAYSPNQSAAICDRNNCSIIL